MWNPFARPSLRAQLNQILQGQEIMSQIVQDLVNAEHAEAAKIDQVLALVTQQSTDIAALKAQIASLPLSPEDAAAITATLADIQAKSDAMGTVLTPPAPTAT